MNFIDNFKIIKTEITPVFRLIYISKYDIEPSAEGEMNRSSVFTNVLNIKLQSRTISGIIPRCDEIVIMRDQVVNALTNEWDVFAQKELVKKSQSVANEINSYINFKGLRKFIYRIAKYSPRVWINSDEFLFLLESTGIRKGWILIAPGNLHRFLNSVQFVYSLENSGSTNYIPYHGKYGSYKIYSSHLISDDEIIVGNTEKEDDQIGLITTEDEWLSVETVTGDTKLGLRKRFATYVIPDRESNYAKWRFSLEKPNFWKWIKKELFT
jgi:hypothetical protein